MSSRSPSGVASLRARFEQNGEDTSPPSRGRSPAGSVTSSSSRPLSKVRTSFVAVEPSGYMASEIGSKGLDGVNEAVTEDNGENSKPTITKSDGGTMDNQETNGDATLPQEGVNPTISVTGDQSSAEPTASSKSEKAIGDATSANPDKPVSTAQDDTAAMLPADLKDEGTVSGGAALAEKTPELGSILKGSPFEEKEAKKPSMTKVSKPTAAAASQPSKAPNKTPSAGPVNGKPKEAPPAKPASAQPSKLQEKAPIVGDPNSKTKEVQAAKPATEPKPKAAPPAPIDTQPAAPPAPSTAPEASETKQENSAPTAPRTPNSVNASGKQPLSKAVSPAKTAAPKVDPPKEAKKPLEKEEKSLVSRPPVISKPPTSTAPKPVPASITSTGRTVKKPGPTSPGFVKPKPKSPTRPVRLPASATAPTAASAAKLDGAPPAAAVGTRGRTNSNPKPPVRKTSRASLPAGSKPADKAKAPRSRMSMASTQAPPGSFLERMMRPTQSSAQKTHEKVEIKSPPRKSHPSRPKRTSEGSEKSKSDQGDNMADHTQEPAAEASLPAAEGSHALSTNGAAEKTNGAVTTAPAEISVQ